MFFQAEDGYCLDENGEDQNRGSHTFEDIPNTFSPIDCLEKCLNQTNVKGCEYDEYTQGCAYHTMPVSRGSGSRTSHWCWVLNNGMYFILIHKIFTNLFQCKKQKKFKFVCPLITFYFRVIL